MKTWNLIRSVLLLAAASSAVAAAYAGTIITPATPTKYAAEGLTPTEPVTLPRITYRLGIPRAASANYTLIYKPSNGSTFDPTSCVPANLSGTAFTAGNTTFSTKVAAPTVCTFDATVIGAGSTAGQTIVFTGLQLATHHLAVAGGSESVTVNLKDPGETSQIDNAEALTVAVAISVNAVNIFATLTTPDRFTVADVNNANGPLRGFVPSAVFPGDDTSIAAVAIRLENNPDNAVKPGGVLPYNFFETNGTATVTVTDSQNFAGLKPGKFCLDLDRFPNGALAGPAGKCDPGEAFTIAGNVATLVIPAQTFPLLRDFRNITMSFEADGVSSLGTGRTFSLNSVITPGTGVRLPYVAGAPHASSDPNGVNSTFWIWGANGIQLWQPYVSNADGWISRFLFINTGPAVTYSVACTGEGTVNVVSPTGTLNAGTTKIELINTCTFANPARGSIIFTIGGAPGNIHGQYVLVSIATGAQTGVEMTRPYKDPTF